MIRTIALIILFIPQLLSAANTMTITEADGVSKTNYPVQIGTMFVAGEIANFPKIKLDGVAITTQAVVKRKWADGSVRHAILNFLIPSMTANQTIAVTFENQASGNNTALTKTQMLDSGYGFDADIVADFGGGDINTISARAMLNADNYTEWLGGSVATSIILADHSASRAYDFGDDSYNSLRPIFNATFWPTINKVLVRYIVENSNTEVLQDQTYDVELTLGDASPSSQFAQSAVLHFGGSRWTRSYWIGGDPGNVDIKYNLPYLVSTGEIFSYDTTLSITAGIVDTAYTKWLATDKTLFGKGGYVSRHMADSGGRDELGPYPNWITYLLYTGSSKMMEISKGNADLFGAFPVFFREGDATKYLDRDLTIPGIGKIMTINDRPSLTLDVTSLYDYPSQDADDKVTTVGTTTRGLAPDDWLPDVAHQPDPYSVVYQLTGDWFYLESDMMWAATTCPLKSNGAAINQSYGRGPTGAECGPDGSELRAKSYIVRSMVTTATIIPDTMPEKEVFNTFVNDIVSILEGFFDITTTGNYGNTNWNWGRNVMSTNPEFQANSVPPPFGQFMLGSTSYAQAGYGIDDTVTGMAQSQYEQGYMTIYLGRAYQLGFAFEALLKQVGAWYVNAINDPAYTPYLLTWGRIPVAGVDGTYFSTMAEVKAGWLASFTANGQTAYPLTGTQWAHEMVNGPDLSHGYDFISNAATAAIGSTDLTNAASSATYMYNEIGSYVNFGDNPKWAMVPFNPNDQLTTTTCSVNPSKCTDQTICEAASWEWCGTYCNATTCPTSPSCPSTPSLCNETECWTNGLNWCTGTCQSASCASSNMHISIGSGAVWSIGTGTPVNILN